MTVRISRALLQRILARAAEAPGQEVCGLLLGSGAGWVEEAVDTANVAGNRADSFEVDPVALFAALRAERSGGPRLLGHYHSHPGGSPAPSARDAMMASAPGRLWLIVGGSEARLWREMPGGSVQGAFEPVRLVAVDRISG